MGRKLGLKTAVVAAAAALALIAGAAAAYAAGETAMTPEQLTELFNLMKDSPVFVEECDMCHGSLVAKDTSRISEINFSHGYHRGQFDCSACHSKFPHSPSGVVKPTMDGCFACHGLRHGPVGIVASDKCEDCHKTSRDRLRPAFHTPDWAEKPHVAPGQKQLQTKCMMCHKGEFCDDCHTAEYIEWKPSVPYSYDPGDGCMSCHGQVSMLRTGVAGTVSFQVNELDASAHSNLPCVKCHVDFKYEDGADSTPLWQVNAGLACQNCHDHGEQKTAYESSVHWSKIQEGDLESATCASCHGGHKIQRLDTDFAKRALHSSALEVCARCHREYYDAYNDYYHGAAYKRGTPDAPACWDCHGAHDVLPSKDPSSSVAPANTPATCAGEGCHRDTSEEFVKQAKSLIHKKDTTAGDNPLVKFFDGIRKWFGGGSA